MDEIIMLLIWCAGLSALFGLCTWIAEEIDRIQNKPQARCRKLSKRWRRF